jgi:hypothetical protein
MGRVLTDLLPAASVAVFDAVPPFVKFLDHNAATTVLISLDHDLTRPCTVVPEDQRGDGRSACDHLVTLPPFCPVIVHSSNYAAVTTMLDALRTAGWPAHLVTPCSDPEYAWIDTEWADQVRRLFDSGWLAAPSSTP